LSKRAPAFSTHQEKSGAKRIDKFAVQPHLVAVNSSFVIPNSSFAQMPDISLEKVLPNNLEAERSILGAVLLDDKAVLTVFELLKPQDFYLDSNRRIFEKMHLLIR
jgi:hypothetical protein